MNMPNLRYCQTCRFAVREGHFRRHTFSVAHTKAKLIRSMLERNCITHADIARRIGVTRERVRQLALLMGFADGRSRHAICRIDRRKKEMAEFFVEAEKRGFQVEPLSRRTGTINGKICVQRQACWHTLRTGHYRYTYVSIHRSAGRYDICAWKLPDGRFLILPRELVRFNQTTFSLSESDHPGIDGAAHYYREYIERWNVLGHLANAPRV